MRMPGKKEPQPSIQGSSFKRPRRVTITIPQSMYEYLVSRSMNEGRSLSNLCAYLLELSYPGGDSLD